LLSSKRVCHDPAVDANLHKHAYMQELVCYGGISPKVLKALGGIDGYINEVHLMFMDVVWEVQMSRVLLGLCFWYGLDA
jgi:hypothetical protein